MRARANSVEVSPFRRLQVFIIIKIKQEKKTIQIQNGTSIQSYTDFYSLQQNLMDFRVRCLLIL